MSKVTSENKRSNCIMLRLDNYEMEKLKKKINPNIALAKCLRIQLLKSYNIPVLSFERYFDEHNI